MELLLNNVLNNMFYLCVAFIIIITIIIKTVK